MPRLIRHYRNLVSPLTGVFTKISLIPLLALVTWSADWGFPFGSLDSRPLADHRYNHSPGFVILRDPEPLNSGISTIENQPARQEELVLLPDLRTKLPSSLYIQTLEGGGRLLRLANTIWNDGQGPLELTGSFIPATKQTRVKQLVYTSEGDVLEHLVGEFVWHPTHDHWHFDDFTIYELWKLTPAGGLERVISSSDKLSYCVIDTQVVNRENPDFTPRRAYLDCGQKLQGLSVGWGDRYKATLDGQSLDLRGIPDGIYALVSTANPTQVLLESNYDNNAAMMYIEIDSNQIHRVFAKELRGLRGEVNG